MTDIRETGNEQPLEIGEEALLQPNGGDYGDSKWERTHDTFMYREGDIVEVYNSPFHLTTTRGKIIACLKECPRGPKDAAKRRYVIDTLRWYRDPVPADDIERKN